MGTSCRKLDGAKFLECGGLATESVNNSHLVPIVAIGGSLVRSSMIAGAMVCWLSPRTGRPRRAPASAERKVRRGAIMALN